MSIALYIASAVGAVSLLMMMPRKGYTPRALGGLLGAATLGGLWLMLARHLPDVLGLPGAAMGYYYAFSAIAVIAAAKVITHTKPVFAALWFVMVVLASAGLFLVLDAEFMAAALVIIYGGAILVTYVFVIMLASDAGDPADKGSTPEYERIAREPFAATVAGFVLLASLLSVYFSPGAMPRNYAAAESVASVQADLPDRAPQRLADRIEAQGRPVPGALKADLQKVTNVERVGLDLFKSHPLGLELAGVILLVSLVGAVVIARKRVEDIAEPDSA